MESDSTTLDLISSLSMDRSTDQTSEIQSNNTQNNTVSQNHSSKKRKIKSNHGNDNTASNDDAPKKGKRKEMVFSDTIPMPSPLRDLIAEIGGSDIEIVVQKQLQDTDLNKNHGRLSIPINKLLYDFATEAEKEWLTQQKDDDYDHKNKNKNKNEMKVIIIDPALRKSVIGLKLWKIGSGNNYYLVSEWNSLTKRNALESGDYIQLWSFRTNEGANLSFAMVKLDISEGIFKFI